MKVMFVEPPKEEWFVVGDTLPPPNGIIQLAAYLEREVENAEIEVVDCYALHLDWKDLEKKIESFKPDVLASSSLATCNTYVVARTLETAKKIDRSLARRKRHAGPLRSQPDSALDMDQNMLSQWVILGSAVLASRIASQESLNQYLERLLYNAPARMSTPKIIITSGNHGKLICG